MRSAAIVAVVLLLCLMSIASAEPYVSVWGAEATDSYGTSSWFGSVGLIQTPSAFLPPASGATLAYHRIERSGNPNNLYVVNFGVTDWLEVGGGYLDGYMGTSDAVANAKVRLDVPRWFRNMNMPEVAVGGFDLTNSVNRSLYFVMSKSFPLLTDDAAGPRINLHLGFADNELDAGALDGIFAGLEFNALKYGVIQAEYDGENFNADLRYSLGRGFSVDLGILDGDFGWGATYRTKY